MKGEWIRRTCTNKDQAMLLISRLEERKLVFYFRNGEYIVEYERECVILEGECTRIDEENLDELPKQAE